MINHIQNSQLSDNSNLHNENNQHSTTKSQKQQQLFQDIIEKQQQIIVNQQQHQQQSMEKQTHNNYQHQQQNQEKDDKQSIHQTNKDQQNNQDNASQILLNQNHDRYHQSQIALEINQPVKFSEHQQNKQKNNGSENFKLYRLIHLEHVFKHYCTNIFRVGKHMTFQRLQYEKTHMTIQRFFVFLKDFQLTTFMLRQNKKSKQLIPKSNIVMLFKKQSPNAKDITFQQFIECIQKLAIIYYDNYQNIIQSKKNNVKQHKKILKGKMEYKDSTQDKIKQQNKQKAFQDLLQEGVQQVQNYFGLQRQNKTNDNIDDEKAKQNQQPYQQQENMNKDISKQQKIQQFYKKIGVDSSQQYKAKMLSLNLSVVRPIAKSVDLKAKPAASLYSLQEQTQIKKMQQIRDKMKQLRNRIPSKQNKVDQSIRKMQQQIKTKRSQSLANQKNRLGIQKHRYQKSKDFDTQILKNKSQTKQKLPLNNNTIQIKKKRLFKPIKIAQQVQNSMLQKLGLKQLGMTQQDQDEKYLLQYRVQKRIEVKQQKQSQAINKMKPSLSYRVIDNSNKQLFQYPSKAILSRNKSKSSAPSPFHNFNKSKDQIVANSKVQKIVNSARLRALEVKKQQKIEENNKNDMIKKIGKNRFLSKNKN